MAAPKEPTRVLLCLFSVLFLGVADNQIISPLLPAIRAAFDRSPHEAGRLFTGYALAAALSALVWGPVSDRIGARLGLLAGLAGFAAASAASFAAPTFTLLVAARVATGIGASLLSLNTITFAADYFPYRVRGRAMGTIFSSYFAALILGVPLGATASEHLGWQPVFALWGGLALALLGLAWRWLPASGTPAGERPPAAPVRESLRRYAAFLAAAPTGGALVAAMAASGGMMGLLAFLGLWLHDRFGASPRDVGLVFLISGGAALAASPFAGAVSDRIGKKSQFVLANAALAVLVVLLPRLSWGWPLYGIFCAISLASAFRQGPMEALVTEVVPAGQRASFVALKNSCSQVGIALATAASGHLLEQGGYGRVCLFSAALSLLAALATIGLVRREDL